MEPENKKINLTRLLITLGIVLFTALAIGGSTYYVMSSNAKKEKEAQDKQTAEMQKQIDDLQKAQAKKPEITATTTTPETSSSTNNILKVSELGIQFTLPASIRDAYYVMEGEQADFTTRTLVGSGGSDCAAGADKPVNAPLGSINLSTTPPSNGVGDINTGVFIKKIGSKYLYYKPAQSVCSASVSPITAQSQSGAVMQEALKTATAI